MQFLALFLAIIFGAAVAQAEDYTVQRVLAADLKPVAAEVNSSHQATARARIGGTISELKVSEGAEVKRGDVLAVIHDPKQPLAIEATAARLRSLQQERTQAAADVKRYKPLAKTGVVSPAKMEQLTTRLNALDDNIKALKAERDSAVANREEGKVLAPMSGRVLTLPVPLGNVVMPGDVIADLTAGDLVLKIYVPERHARYLKQGMKIRIVSNARDGEESSSDGTVSKIYPEVQQGRVTADVTVSDLSHLYVGERLTAYVPTAQREAIYLPRDYVTRRHGLNYVTLKSGEEIVVELGLEDEHGVEVLSGLNEGDIVVGR